MATVASTATEYILRIDDTNRKGPFFSGSAGSPFPLYTENSLDTFYLSGLQPNLPHVANSTYKTSTVAAGASSLNSVGSRPGLPPFRLGLRNCLCQITVECLRDGK
jgi:hypothetical protein